MFGRPKLDIALAPDRVAPGEDLFVEVLVKCERTARVKYVDVSLLGTEEVHAGEGRRAPKATRVFLSLGTRYETDAIAKGETTFRAKFPIPPLSPRPYPGRAARIAYELVVHAPVPFGRDLRSRRAVHVEPPEVEPPAPTPGVFATSHGGPRGTDPSMELALDTTTLMPGDVLSGQIALANLGKKRVRSVDVSFEQRECVKEPRLYEGVVAFFDTRVFEGTPEDGKAIPFRVKVPERLVPDFYTDYFAVATDLVVSADVAYGDDFILRVPLSILEGQGRSVSKSAERVSIPVGNDRLATLVEAAARALELSYDGGKIEGRVGAIEIVIAVQRDLEAMRTTAVLTWPDLALGLSLGTEGLSERKGRKRLELPEQNVLAPKLSAWAKDEGTAVLFLRHELLALLEPFDRVSMTDGEARVARTGPVVAFDDVLAVGQAAVALAKAIDTARGLLPERDVVREQGMAWEAFAVRYGGKLDRAALRVQDARFEGMGFEVHSSFGEKGQLRAVEIRVRTSSALPKHPLEVKLTGNGALAQKRIIGLLRSGVRVEGRGKDLVLVVPRPVMDPVELLPFLGPIASLGRALDGSLSRLPASARKS